MKSKRTNGESEVNRRSTRAANGLLTPWRRRLEPVTATPAKRPPMDEATKARYKAFGEETRKMALDLAGGDEKKLGQAFRNGMANPATQELFNRGRALGEAMRAAETDAERAALEGQVAALRDEGMGMLKAELEKIDAAANSQPAPAPAAAGPSAKATCRRPRRCRC